MAEERFEIITTGERPGRCWIISRVKSGEPSATKIRPAYFIGWAYHDGRIFPLTYPEELGRDEVAVEMPDGKIYCDHYAIGAYDNIDDAALAYNKALSEFDAENPQLTKTKRPARERRGE